MSGMKKKLIKATFLTAALVLVLFLGFSMYVYSTLLDMRPDRGEDYHARMHYLPNAVPAGSFDMEGFEGWMKRTLHNKLIDKGPYIVAYPLTGGSSGSEVENKPTKGIVILPGGGYIFRSEKLEGTDIAKWLNAQGIAAFVLNYRLQRHPVPLSDVQSAMQYIRSRSDEFNVLPEQLGIMGFSAGGHLAASSITLSPPNTRPDFAILAYPVIHMEGPLSHEGSRLSLIGNDPSPELVTTVSPHRQVSEDTPPAFIWASKTDTVVPWENSQDFADALDAAGVSYELHLFPEGMHGSALAQDETYASAWPFLMLDWLKTL